MLKAAREFVRRFGALGLLLMALGAVVPANAAPACGDDGDRPTARIAMQTATAGAPASPCREDGCGDCGVACAHGCCHAAHAGLPGREAPPVVTATPLRAPSVWSDATGEPFGAPEGLERPPRA